IDAVNARHGEATTLTVEEVERLPDGLLPHVAIDAERTRRDVARAKHIRARLVHGGEVELLEGTESRAGGRHRRAHDDWPERVVARADDVEGRRGEVTRDRGLRASRLVAGIAERDAAGRDVPTGVVVGLDTLELEAPDLEGDAISRPGEHLVNP